MNITRLDYKSQPFHVDERGSDYINELLKQLTYARSLAQEVVNLNSNCLTIGAGYLANMKHKAEQILKP